MSRIKIKNFGPIREGFLNNDGWIDIKKVTVLIGDQGSGKSTVAKLISVFSWLEKSIVRKDIQIEQLNMSVLKTLCAQQEISEYFGNGAYISYEGDVCNFECDESQNLFTGSFSEKKLDNYVMPKIQYISAARNLLTILYNIYLQNIRDKNGNVVDLSSNIPFMVKDLNKEYLSALAELAKDGFSLPINETSVYFQNYSTFIKTRGKKVYISAASSGIQSITPLMIVSHFLSYEVQKDLFDRIKNIDDKQKSRIESRLSKEDDILSEKFKQLYSFGKGIFTDTKDVNLLEAKLKKYIPSSFINIVEEPEQNLFPTSQQKVINKLLEYNNAINCNKLIITTHSPYIISYLTLAIKASEIESKANENQPIKSDLYEIVPEMAITALQDTVIYELDEQTGTISQLEQSLGLPSNDNYLNNQLGETNVLFSKLLEIEDLCEE